MIINCELCGQEIEVPDGLADGQHVRCPYCEGKFLFSDSRECVAAPVPPDSVTERIKSVAKGLCLGWVDAYKRLFDFKGRSDRVQLCGFLVCQWLFDKLVFENVAEIFLWNRVGVYVMQIEFALSVYAGMSLGVRRLHDIGRTGNWMLMLAFVFIAGYICDVGACSNNQLMSPLFMSVFRIKYYVAFALLAICWIQGKEAECVVRGSRSLKLSVVGLIALFLLLQLAQYEVKAKANSYRDKMVALREKAERDAPFHQISYSVSSLDSSSSTYFVNTDGPANAQFMLFYVMGRLQLCNLIQYDDAKAAKRAQDYIEKRFELEGSLRSIGRR